MMHAIRIDTLAFSKRLKEAGADERLAEAIVEGITSADTSELATKADVAAVKADIAEVKTEIAEVKADLKAEIAGLRTEVARNANRLLFAILGIGGALLVAILRNSLGI